MPKEVCVVLGIVAVALMAMAFGIGQQFHENGGNSTSHLLKMGKQIRNCLLEAKQEGLSQEEIRHRIDLEVKRNTENKK